MKICSTCHYHWIYDDDNELGSKCQLINRVVEPMDDDCENWKEPEAHQFKTLDELLRNERWY